MSDGLVHAVSHPVQGLPEIGDALKKRWRDGTTAVVMTKDGPMERLRRQHGCGAAFVGGEVGCRALFDRLLERDFCDARSAWTSPVGR
ncbi:MAG: hypothetical protein U1F60_01125 [Planctomycetota bacterium]